jgi:hypothetical protein
MNEVMKKQENFKTEGRNGRQKRCNDEDKIGKFYEVNLINLFSSFSIRFILILHSHIRIGLPNDLL